MVLSRRRLLLTGSALITAVGTGHWYWHNRWRYIVIHHSAGNFGTVEFLQRVHRQRQAGDPIDAIPYHYLIGNGNGLAEGEIASDWRRDNNIWGSHVSGNNWSHNWRGIGICLIGNFELYPIPPLQYQALVSLTQLLMHRYDIDPYHVTGHGYLDGESTLCPGRFFSLQQFRQDIT